MSRNTLTIGLALLVFGIISLGLVLPKGEVKHPIASPWEPVETIKRVGVTMVVVNGEDGERAIVASEPVEIK